MATGKSPSLLLVENGFIKSGSKHKYSFDEKSAKFDISDKEKFGSISEKDADEEETEEVDLSNIGFSGLQKTGFPNPVKRYRLIVENFNLSMEETYYWFLNHLRQDQAFPRVDKITDVFSASETSAFFGQSAQRLSIQEDRASGFLRGISELVKQLFQIIRELRIIDERMEAYDAWEKKDKNGKIIRSKSADVTLKGFFSDFAENKGGQMQPGSIYHLSQQVGYATLPDLFFNTHIYSSKDVDKVIDKMKQFNPNVKNVLKRKLFQFLVWKEKTEVELVNRRKFQIRYLRQHWAVIKMYMSWTKPYLRHIKKLHMNERQMDSPDLVTAFETSMTEIEFLCVKPAVSGFHPCVLVTFQYNTKPTLSYRQEYQQGPVHIGRVSVTLRAYGWDDNQINNYKKLRETEDMELLSLVDDSVQMAMEELGDDLNKYLNEEENRIFDKDIHDKYGKKESKPSSPKKVAKLKQIQTSSALEPFTALFGGVWDIANAFVPFNKVSFSKTKSKPKGNPSKAAKAAMGPMWQAYKNYKKSHGLTSW